MDEGRYREDLITFADEEQPGEDWSALLTQVMRSGGAIESPPASRDEHRSRLNAARERSLKEIERLPDEILALDSRAHFPVRFSPRLTRERERLQKEKAG
jgi:hypothetical protein